MVNKKVIAVTELIKKLGYENTSKLSDKVRETLEEKENFKRFVSTDSSKGKRGGERPEKCLVELEAEVLVDNICYLHQYPYLFGKAEKNSIQYPPYTKWKQGIDEAEFNVCLDQFKKRLETTIERSEYSLKLVNNFAPFVLSNKNIDLEKQRLRSLVKTSQVKVDDHDTSRAFESGTWSEVLELNEQLEQGVETSLLYQQIGEKLIQLGESDQARESLNRSLELDPENGVAWALLSILLFDEFQEANSEFNLALSRTDYSGEITNPISTEEHWINDRVEETSGNARYVEKAFIECAINALKNWPVWQAGREHRAGRKNYTLCLSHDRQSQIQLSRDKLFYNLITSTSVSALSEMKEHFIQVVRDFQSNNMDMLYPFYSLFTVKILPFKEAMFEKLQWISNEDEARAVAEIVRLCNEGPVYSQFENLQLLNNIVIQRSMMRIIGVIKYSELVDKLNDSQYEYQKLKKVDAMAKIQLCEFSSQLSEFKTTVTKLKWQLWDVGLNEDVVKEMRLTDKLEACLNLSSIKVEQVAKDWQFYASIIDWNKWSTFDSPVTGAVPTLVFLSLICSAINKKSIVEEEVLQLKQFLENPHVLAIVVQHIDTSFFNCLLFIKTIQVLSDHESNLINLIYNSIERAQGDIADEMEMYDEY